MTPGIASPALFAPWLPRDPRVLQSPECRPSALASSYDRTWKKGHPETRLSYLRVDLGARVQASCAEQVEHSTIPLRTRRSGLLRPHGEHDECTGENRIGTH